MSAVLLETYWVAGRITEFVKAAVPEVTIFSKHTASPPEAPSLGGCPCPLTNELLSGSTTSHRADLLLPQAAQPNTCALAWNRRLPEQTVIGQGRRIAWARGRGAWNRSKMLSLKRGS